MYILKNFIHVLFVLVFVFRIYFTVVVFFVCVQMYVCMYVNVCRSNFCFISPLMNERNKEHTQVKYVQLMFRYDLFPVYRNQGTFICLLISNKVFVSFSPSQDELINSKPLCQMECRENIFTLQSQKDSGIIWEKMPQAIASTLICFFLAVLKIKIVFLEDIEWNIHNLSYTAHFNLSCKGLFHKDHSIRSCNSDPLSHQFIVFDGWFWMSSSPQRKEHST